jgi:hypothetical protein
MGWYPDIKSKNFDNELYSIKEFTEDTIKKDGLYLEPYQSFVRKFINRNTPYYSLMLYWSYGRGKTLGSISILENFREFINKENGLEKFLIITKNDTLQTVFKNELIKYPYDNPYITQIEKNKISDPEVQKNIKNRVKLRYDFVNYDELTNRILEKDPIKRISLENRIIVIDEVQNITGNFRYVALMNALKNVTNSRIIILSATPVMDNVEELVYITNILNFKNPVFDIDIPLEIKKPTQEYRETVEKKLREKIKSLYSDKGILTYKNIKNNTSINTEFNKIPKFTDKGKKILKDTLRGRISYTEGNYLSFPKIIRKGIPLTNKEGSIRIVKCIMSEYQEKVYLEALKEKSQFYKLQSDVLTMVYEADKIKDKFSKINLSKTNVSLQTLGKYSSKIHNILHNIFTKKGIHFIYSNYVDTSGTNLLEYILKKNGFVNYVNNNNTNMKYVKYTEGLNNQERVKIQEIINSKENLNGDKIKVIIGSPLISEGVSFKNVKYVHILEPYWNLGRNIQAEGRCVRNYSHIMLPPEERNVEIYYYVSVFGNKKLENNDTVDIYKYRLCEEKDREIKNTQRILKEIAIDCYNNKQINKDNKNNSLIDNTAECDYQKCEYQCVFINPDKIKKELNDITYNKYSDPQQIQWCEYFIKNLFNKSDIWDISNILKNTRQVNIDDFNTFYALENLVKNKKEFVTKEKGLGYIKYEKGVYFFKNKKQKEQKQEKNIEKFIPQKKETNKKKEINYLQENIRNIDLDFFGITTKDKKFIIIDRRNEEDRSSTRDLARGRNCTTYLKEDISNMIKFLKKSEVKLKTKKEMCDFLQKEMEKNNILFKE